MTDIVETWIDVPGLRPEVVHTATGAIRQDDNLQERLPEVQAALDARPWLKDLWRDIRQGRRSATVVVCLGGLLVVTAVGAEFEFGMRRGRDVRDLVKLLKVARRAARLKR